MTTDTKYILFTFSYIMFLFGGTLGLTIINDMLGVAFFAVFYVLWMWQPKWFVRLSKKLLRIKPTPKVKKEVKVKEVPTIKGRSIKDIANDITFDIFEADDDVIDNVTSMSKIIEKH